MKLISGWMALLIRKICIIGQQQTQICFLRHRCIRKKWLFGANKPATLDDLKDNIQREIANVPVEMCARVVENWVQRIDRCKRARGGHMTDIEFHS